MADSEPSIGFDPGKFPYNPEKVTRFVPLIAVLAGVMWAIALVWLLSADSGAERTTAGIIAAALFLSVLGTLIYFARTLPRAIVDAPPEEITEIAKGLANTPVVRSVDHGWTQSKLIVGKNQDFVIADPRPQWNVRWTTLASLLLEESGIVDNEIVEHFKSTAVGYDEAILIIGSPVEYRIGIVVNTTRTNGLPVRNLYHGPVSARLMIAARNKFASLFADPQPLLSFAVERTAGMVQSGSVPRSIQRVVRSDGRDAIVLEADEVLERVTVNDIPDQTFVTRHTLVCIEGPVKFYQILLTYPEASVVAPADLEQLRQIVDSFRITEEVAPMEATSAALADAQAARINYLKTIRPQVLDANMTLMLNRLTTLDLGKPEGLEEAIREVGRFSELAKSLGDDESDYDDFLAAWNEAKAGDTEDFLDQLSEALESVSD